jgi:alpha-N-arabinofuranosidase
MIFKYDPGIKIQKKEDGIYLSWLVDKKIFKLNNELVNTSLLGKAIVPDLPFVNPDGSEIKVDKDYFGRDRNLKKPNPGPFENPGNNLVTLKVWKK